MAHQESPIECQSPRRLLKHTMYVLIIRCNSSMNWEIIKWILICSVHILNEFDVLLNPPSPSSIRQERSAFLFRIKDSAKLRSDEPQADGRTSLSIFPPHVTLRLGNLKTGNESLWWEWKKAVQYNFFLCHIYLLNRNQVWAGNEQFSQVFDSVLLFSLELILFLEQLGENLLLCRCGLCDWRNLCVCVGGCHPWVIG